MGAELIDDRGKFALPGLFEEDFELSVEIALAAESVAFAGAEFGFFAAQDEGGECLEVLRGDFGCRRGVENLAVGCQGGREGFIGVVEF